MNQETDDPIEQLRAQVERLDQLRRELLEAQESLDREVYQLDLTETRLQMAEDEIRKLESLSLTGLVCSLFGDRVGRIDELREQCRALERQREEQNRSAESLQRQIEQLNGQVAELAEAEAQLQALCPSDAGSAHPGGTPDTAGRPPSVATDLTHRIELAIDAGESLLGLLNGSYRTCHNLRHGRGLPGRGGALLSAAMQACRDRNANTFTGQIAESVGYFCDRIAEISLNADEQAGAEILAAFTQLQRFADSGGTILGTQTEAWAELEILARGLVTDLQDLVTPRSA